MVSNVADNVARNPVRTERYTALFVGLVYLLALAVLNALYWLYAGFDQPLADLHQFRQTQTAITAYWIWRGGPLFAYWTPVLGYPWSLPFEFPLYQYLMVLLRWVGIPFAEGGRLVSYAFYLGLLWPLRVLFKNLHLNIVDYLIVAVLLMTSPLYLYWSRAVMIESCALFFALAWLAFLLQFLNTGSKRDGAVATVIGVVAINVKITTFVTFGLIGGLLYLYIAIGILRDGRLRERWPYLLLGAVAGLVPFFSGLAWDAFADQVKFANLLASTDLLSSLMAKWNFGTMAQRFSVQFWFGTIMNRITPDILGFSIYPALLAAGAALLSRKYFWPVLFSIGGFFGAMLIFTNLHIEHNYYQYCNALFLLAAVGFGLASIADAGRPILSGALLLLVVAGQLIYFSIGFARIITADYSNARTVTVGALAKNATSPDESLIILGDDWSSAIAFDSERKSLTLPYWARGEDIARIFADPQTYLGDAPLGGIVYCADQLQGYGDNQNQVVQFTAGRKVLGEAGGCQLLAPQR